MSEIEEKDNLSNDYNESTTIGEEKQDDDPKEVKAEQEIPTAEAPPQKEPPSNDGIKKEPLPAEEQNVKVEEEKNADKPAIPPTSAAPHPVKDEDDSTTFNSGKAGGMDNKLLMKEIDDEAPKTFPQVVSDHYPVTALIFTMALRLSMKVSSTS